MKQLFGNGNKQQGFINTILIILILLIIVSTAGFLLFQNYVKKPEASIDKTEQKEVLEPIDKEADKKAEKSAESPKPVVKIEKPSVAVAKNFSVDCSGNVEQCMTDGNCSESDIKCLTEQMSLARDFFFEQLKNCSISKTTTMFFNYNILSQDDGNCIINISPTDFTPPPISIINGTSMECKIQKGTTAEKFPSVLLPSGFGRPTPLFPDKYPESTNPPNCEGSLMGVFERFLDVKSGGFYVIELLARINFGEFKTEGESSGGGYFVEPKN